MPTTNQHSELHEITIQPDGSLQFIWSDSLVGLMDEGEGQITRASHVEPNERGEWMADLSPVGGPSLGPYRLRQDALDAEVAWLRMNSWSITARQPAHS